MALLSFVKAIFLDERSFITLTMKLGLQYVLNYNKQFYISSRGYNKFEAILSFPSSVIPLSVSLVHLHIY